MTYNVFSGTLNLTQSINQSSEQCAVAADRDSNLQPMNHNVRHTTRCTKQTRHHLGYVLAAST